ncbi:MAG: T9SS type A sorting domain-containing protein [Ignavibacteriaceae bacterium]|nr:T9SS type A sorting domain-containing protein [Ignavibacteriaceae bacterium]
MKKFLYTIVLLLFTASLGYSQVTTLWEKSETAVTKPYWETGNTTRGLSYGLVNSNHRLYVVNRHADFGGKQIFVFNAATGDSVTALDTTGLAGGTFPVNDVEVSTDGVIFVGNLTTNSSTSAFKVYKYTSEAAAPVEAINYTSVAVYRLGDKFTVTGSTADNSIVIWAANAAATGEVVKFTTTDNGVTFTPAIVNIGALVSFSSAAIGPLPNDDFYFNAHGMNAQKYTSTGTLIGTIPNTVLSTSGSASRYLNLFLGDEYVVANDLFTTTSNNAKIIKVPGSVPASATLFASTPMLGLTSAGGLGDVSAQKVSDYVYIVYVLATNNGFGAYQVDLRTPLAGDYYIPQGVNPQGFATLNDAVASLNINGATGTVNFLLDADTLRENTFTIDADLSADNNVIIKPAAGRDVTLIVTASGSVGNGPFMIGFNSGYVTFDGSNNGTDTRNLLVTTEQMDPVVDVPFTLNNANADSVVLKNLIIKNIVVGQTNFRYGAVINDLGGVMYFRVENCQIGTAERPVRRDGLAPWGGGAISNQFSFVNNEIYCGTRGVATIYLVDSEIIGNTINIMPTTAGATDSYNHGIYITGHAGILNILGNTINCLEKTINVSAYLVGIAFAGNSSTETDTINVFNNFINVGAADETRYTYGIGLRSANPMGNLKVYFNTILINDNASALVSYGIGNHTNGTGSVDVDLKNNIIINNHTGNTGSSAIGLVPATSVLTSDYNVLLSNQNLVNYQGTLYADLAAWQVTTQDANSVSKAVNFVSATDLHLTGSSDGDFDLAGTPIAGITTDIDGDTRGTIYPYMGADEGTTPLTLPADFWTENFDYPADDLLTDHGWIAHSGAGTNPISVNSFGLEFPGYPGSGIGLAALLDNTGEDTHRLFPATTSGSVYTSFMVRIDAAPTGYFFHYAPNPHNTFDFRGRVWVKTDGAGGLAIGYSFQSADTIFTDFDYSLGDTLLLVSKYESVPGADNDVASLFIFDANNPSTGTEPGTPTLGPIVNPATGQSDIEAGSINLRQYNSAQIMIVDGITVSTSWDQIVPVEPEDNTAMPSTFALSQNYPNPFNPSTTIRYDLPEAGFVDLRVYNSLGEEVAVLVNQEQVSGVYEVNFDASMLASGVYFYRINSGKFVTTKKMMLIK